jgi:hypothetical protein
VANTKAPAEYRGFLYANDERWTFAGANRLLHAKKFGLIPASSAVPATTEKNQYDEKDD